MSLKKPVMIALLAATMSLPLLAQAQPGYGRDWPGGGPGPYSPSGAGPYAAGNPYAQQLNELAVKNPEKQATSPDQAFHVELTEPGNADSPLVWVGREDGQPVRYNREPLASWWRRAVSSLLGALAPEELL